VEDNLTARQGKSTHLEYVLLTAFPPQKLLRKRTSISRYTWVHCLSYLGNITKFVTFFQFYDHDGNNFFNNVNLGFVTARKQDKGIAPKCK
jgi:hypothetical protein